MPRLRATIPLWSIVVAVLAALVWAVGVPVVVALTEDVSRGMLEWPRPAQPLPAWLVDPAEQEPLPAAFDRVSPIVAVHTRSATTMYQGEDHRVDYWRRTYGFPWPALARDAVGVRYVSGNALGIEHALELHDRLGWRRGIMIGRGQGNNPRSLPTVPLWGLLANALLVALPIVIAATGWRMLVRRRRLARGCCPVCGYGEAARAGSCSECGWGVAEPAGA
ncbi:MAG: hypothetical protein NCW75_14290 [Phycisphaera sp.]|nr:MAG: hypothetical protein NCW75_14290 [Phycisphaera sp.]